MPITLILLALATQAADPVPTGIDGWFSAESYPRDAATLGLSGKVGIRLAVDRAGRITDCAITDTSGSPMLDAATCAVARRKGRFRPARDAGGTAVAGTFSQTVAWVAPNEAAARVASSTLATLTFVPGTQTAKCRVTVNGAPLTEATRDLCAEFGMGPDTIGNIAETLGRQPHSVTVQIAIHFPDSPAPALIDTIAGESMLTHSRAGFTVSPGGAVTDCRIEDVRGAAGFDLCEVARGVSYVAKPDVTETGTIVAVATYRMTP